MSVKRYKEIIDEMKVARLKKSKKSSYEYRILNNYEILNVVDQEFLISKKEYEENKEQILYYVSNEDLY